MTNKNFKLHLRFIINLSPRKQLIEIVNEHIIQADNSKDCLYKAINIINETIEKAKQNVNATKLKEMEIYELKEIPPDGIEAEAAFFWMMKNKVLPNYDPIKIVTFFDRYQRRENIF